MCQRAAGGDGCHSKDEEQRRCLERLHVPAAVTGQAEALGTVGEGGTGRGEGLSRVVCYRK